MTSCAARAGVAVWRAQNDTARQKLDGLVVSPVMTPAPLFNSPYDVLMRRNQLRNDLE